MEGKSVHREYWVYGNEEDKANGRFSGGRTTGGGRMGQGEGAEQHRTTTGSCLSTLKAESSVPDTDFWEFTQVTRRKPNPKPSRNPVEPFLGKQASPVLICPAGLNIQ